MLRTNERKKWKRKKKRKTFSSYCSHVFFVFLCVNKCMWTGKIIHWKKGKWQTKKKEIKLIRAAITKPLKYRITIHSLVSYSLHLSQKKYAKKRKRQRYTHIRNYKLIFKKEMFETQVNPLVKRRKFIFLVKGRERLVFWQSFASLKIF